MSKKYSHTCRVCGAGYDGCNYCEGQRGKTFMWRQVACSMECAQEYIRRVMEARNPKPESEVAQSINDDAHQSDQPVLLSEDKEVLDTSLEKTKRKKKF